MTIYKDIDYFHCLGNNCLFGFFCKDLIYIYITLSALYITGYISLAFFTQIFVSNAGPCQQLLLSWPQHCVLSWSFQQVQKNLNPSKNFVFCSYELAVTRAHVSKHEYLTAKQYIVYKQTCICIFRGSILL